MRSSPKAILLILASVGLSFECSALDTGSSGDIDQFLKRNIDSLTSPQFDGRNAPGTSGEKTANFIINTASELTALHGEIINQPAPLIQATLAAGPTVISLISPQKMFLSNWGKVFYIFPRRIGQIDVNSSTLYCGYGISIPEAGRNDYPADVQGKAAIVLAGSDLPADKAGMRSSAAFKAAAAERAGAVALVVVYTDTLWPPPELSSKIAESSKPIVDLPESTAEFPVAYVHLPGVPVQEIKAFENVNMRVSFNKPVEVQSSNVIVKLDGKVDEWIVVGAHYDHLGSGYPGADDNASGVAGLLQLTRQFTQRDNLNRGLIFVWFTAEEDGLLGSKWFLQNPPVAKEKIVAMINLDMIGRNGFASMKQAMKPGETPDSAYAAAYFSGGSPNLRDLLRAASSNVDLRVSIEPVNTFRHFGDAAPFHEAHIPTVHIFSGFHPDYHASTDTPDKIDYHKLVRMIDLVGRVVENLTTVPDRPAFDPSIKVESKGMGY